MDIDMTTDHSEFEKRVRALVDDITYKDGYYLICQWDKTFGNRLYLQVQCWRPDTFTGEHGWGYGGKAYLSEHMTDGEILRLAFSLFAKYEEHECREFYKYKGKALFGPHIDPLALWEIADRLDFRPGHDMRVSNCPGFEYDNHQIGRDVCAHCKAPRQEHIA